MDFRPGGGAVSQMTVFGHPVHPMLVAFPIAFFCAVILTDLAYVWTGDPFWARAGVWLLAAAVFMGALAALVGTSDFMLVSDIRRHLAAWCHFLAAVVMLSLGLANVLLRLEDHGAAVLPWGLFMSVVTALMLGVAGWFGGKLVFEHNLGPGLPLYSALDEEESKSPSEEGDEVAKHPDL